MVKKLKVLFCRTCSKPGSTVSPHSKLCKKCAIAKVLQNLDIQTDKNSLECYDILIKRLEAIKKRVKIRRCQYRARLQGLVKSTEKEISLVMNNLGEKYLKVKKSDSRP